MSAPKEAVILAGGGSPAGPLTEVNEEPFLTYLLDYLQPYEIERVILTLSPDWEGVKEYYGSTYNGMLLSYAVEDRPLGSAGAIRSAFARADEDAVFVLRGDSWFEAPLGKLWEAHEKHDGAVTMAMSTPYRKWPYGSYELADDGRLLSFSMDAEVSMEKRISTGVYVVDQFLWDRVEPEDKILSFEYDIVHKYMDQEPFYGFYQEGFFLDLRDEEDLKQAADVLDLEEY